jgi:hypothetical protein
VTAIYQKLCREAPEKAALWIHEDAFTTAGKAIHGESIPDALVGDTAIDFGGSYGKRKLRALHRSHAMEGQSYEIW